MFSVFNITWGGVVPIITILHRGEGSIGTPNLYYVINGRSLIPPSRSLSTDMSPTYHRGHYHQTCLVILTIYYLAAQGKHGPVNSSMINWSPLVLSWTSVWSLILIMINTIADVFDLIECSCEFLNWLLVKPHSIFIHARPCKIQSDFKGFQNTVIWNYETCLNKWQYDDDCVTDRIVK